MKTSHTALSYLLMSMLNREDLTGYALCKNIEQLPIGRMSASPGSIYPCLNKLETDGCISGKVIGGNVKPRRRFHLTAKGKRTLRKWSDETLTAAMIMKSPETLFIRLSFLDQPSDTLSRQLAALGEDLENQRKELAGFNDHAQANMHVGGRLAIELALDLLVFYSRWAEKVERSMNTD